MTTLTSVRELMQSKGINCQVDLELNGLSTNYNRPTRFSTDESDPRDEAGWAVIFNNHDGSRVIKAGDFRTGIEVAFSVTKGASNFKMPKEIERVQTAQPLNGLPALNAGSRYLINRGIKKSVIDQLSNDVRFLDSVPYVKIDSNKNYKTILTSSAIVSIVRSSETGDMTAWHKIHTDKDGNKPAILLEQGLPTKKIKSVNNAKKLENCFINLFEAIPEGNSDFESAIGIVEGVESGIALRQLGFSAAIYSLSSTAGYQSLKLPVGSRVYLAAEGDAANEKAQRTLYTNNSDCDVRIFNFGEKTDANDYLLKGNLELPQAIPFMQHQQKVKPPFNPPAISTEDYVDEGEDNLPAFSNVTFNNKGDILKVEATIENVDVLLKRHGIVVRYNDMSHKMEIEFTHCSEEEKNALGYNAHSHLDTMMTDILNYAVLVKMPPTRVAEMVGRLAMKNRYHPIASWIETKAWDGVSRFDDLMNTVQVEADEEALKRIFFRRWMVSAIGALYLPKGIGAEGTIVFSGQHGTGKSRWVRALVPAFLRDEATKEGATLDPKDKDSVNQVVTKWMVELGEIDATFRKADIAELKSFLTKSVDEYRLPYARYESRFPRRTVFFGTVNEKSFLNDQTGNRRFWPLSPTKINHGHDIDLQQLWAEVKTWFDAGEQWWLNDDERALLNRNDGRYRVTSSIEEFFNESFYTKDGQLRKQVYLEKMDRAKGVFDFSRGVTIVECLQSMGIKGDDRIKQRELSSYFSHTLGLVSKRTSRGQLWTLLEYLPGFEAETFVPVDASNIKPFVPKGYSKPKDSKPANNSDDSKQPAVYEDYFGDDTEFAALWGSPVTKTN